MYITQISKSLSNQVKEDKCVFVKIRGNITYSFISELQSSNKTHYFPCFSKPHYAIAIENARVVRNRKAMFDPSYKAVVEFLDSKFRNNACFYTASFNNYSFVSPFDEISLEEGESLPGDLAKGLDCTLDIVFYKDPDDGYIKQTFYGIELNEPIRFYSRERRKCQKGADL
jgi:hypothetical protein